MPKSRFFLISVSVFVATILLAGCKGGDSGGSSGDTATVYASGYVKYSTTENIAGYWMNGSWTGVSDGINTALARIVTLSGSDVYLTGYLNFDGISVAGYWKNGSWNGRGNPYGARNAAAVTHMTSGSDIYLGGAVRDNADEPHACLWKNYDVFKYDAVISSIKTAFIYDNMLLAGGYVEDANGYKVASVWRIYSLDNPSSGTAIPGAAQYTSGANDGGTTSLVDSEINSLVVTGSKIFAGGYCINGSGKRVAGYWVDGVWKGLSGGINNAVVNTMVVTGTESAYTVYAAGYTNDGNINVAGYWKVTGNGSSVEWVPFLDEDGDVSVSEVYSIMVDGGDIYAGGHTSFNACYWKNGTRVDLAPDESTYSCVYSLIVTH